LGKEYVKRYFPPDSKAKVEALVNQLKLGLAHRIENLSWMTPATTAKALEKLSLFAVKIGYAKRPTAGRCLCRKYPILPPKECRGSNCGQAGFLKTLLRQIRVSNRCPGMSATTVAFLESSHARLQPGRGVVCS
jgi:hypothetical protein